MGRLSRVVQSIRRRWRRVSQHPSNQGSRLRRAGHAIRFEVGARMGRDVVIPFATESKVYATKGGNSSERVALSRLPDWPEMAVWQAWLHPGDLFVDVGANVGLYTLLATEQGADVIAVEPEPTTAKALRRNLALNARDDRVRVEQKILLDRPGNADLAGKDANRQTATRSDDGEFSVTTLDDLLGDRSAAGVKIDVEGNERLVLEGARRALSEDRIGLLQLEWNTTSQSALGEDRGPTAALLKELGYVLVRVDGGVSRVSAVTGEAVVTTYKDVFAVPEDRVDRLSAVLSGRDGGRV